MPVSDAPARVQRAIPAILVAGFRGGGKSSVIASLVAQRAPGETWAVIGNGAVGGPGVVAQAVAPDCLCCTGLLAFRVGLTRLLRRTARMPPALLLIEGGPEGHVESVRAALAAAMFTPLLRLERVLGVFDPRWFSNPVPAAEAALRHLGAGVDAIICNKADMADDELRVRVGTYLALLDPPRPAVWARDGVVALDFARQAVIDGIAE